MKMKSNTSKSVRNVVLTALMAAPVALVPTALRALPSTDSSNVSVVNGSASFNSVGTNLTVTASDKTILEWGAFGSGTSTIAAGDTVNFALPSASSAILNRVVGTGTTQIDGSIVSNGKVYILNPNGIAIGATGSVNTAAFYASTVQESNTNFVTSGTLTFSGATTHDVSVASGAALTGDIYLVGKGVSVDAAVTGNLTVKSFEGGAVSIDGSVSKSLTVDAQGTSAAVTLADGLTVTNNLTVTATGAIASGSVAGITNSGSSSVASFTSTGAGVAVKGDFNVVKVAAVNNSSITDANDVIIGTTVIGGSSKTLAITATAGSILANDADTVSASGVITLSVGAGEDATLQGTGAITVATANANADELTISSSGKIQLNTVTATTLDVTSTGDAIASASSSPGVITATSASFSAAKAINLTGANMVGTVVLKNTSADSAVYFKTASDLVVDGGTSIAGAATIETTNAADVDVTLGSASNDVLTFGKTLVLDLDASTGSIDTVANTVNVTDVSTLSVAGAGTINYGTALANNNSSFGRIDVTAAGGAVALFENGTLNVGTVTNTAGALSFGSNASIVNTGVIKATTVALTADGDVTLDQANKITGLITVNAADNVTIKNQVDTSVTGVAGEVSGVARFVVADDKSLTVTGDFKTVEFSASGDGSVSIVDSTGNLTIQNSTYSGTNSVSIAATDGTAGKGNLVIGAGNNLSTDGDISANTTFIAAGDITQTGAISIYNNAIFNAGGSVVLDASGNSFGTVTLTASDDSVLSEAGYLKLAAINVGANSLSLKSETSGIEVINLAGNGITAEDLTISSKGIVSAASTNITNAITGVIAVSAVGDTSIKTTSASVTLGDISVTSGKLAISSTAANGSISQDSDTKIYSYGDASFTATGTGTITLTNSGNGFGKLTLVTTSGNISVKEATTLNLTKVATSGNLSVESEYGSIIDTAGSNTIAAAKATFLTSAAAADVLIDDGKADFTSVVVRTKGNAKIVDADTSSNGLVIVGDEDGTNVGGTFSVKTKNAITDLGSLYIGGDVSFESTAAGITLDGAHNSFGAVKLVAAGNVDVLEETTFNLAAGSAVTGNTVITSFGNIVTSGTGGSTFNGSLRLNSGGTITLSNVIAVSNGLTLSAPGARDISILSQSTNLNGIAPSWVPAKTSADKGPQS